MQHDDLVNLETAQPPDEDDSNLQELEESLNLMNLNQEEKVEETETESDIHTFLRFPRASKIFGNRFELPIDLKKLKSIYFKF